MNKNDIIELKIEDMGIDGEGIGKYEAIYRYPLKPFLAEAAGVSDILFCNDVGAFALGELHFGAAAGTQRAMFLCIGTGCGSTFSTGGQLTGSETPGVPHHGYVYDTPFLAAALTIISPSAALRR